MVRKTPYTIQVTITTNIETHARIYERGSMNISKPAFDAFAIGDLLGIVSDGFSHPILVSEVKVEQVNALEHHRIFGGEHATRSEPR